MQQPGQRSNTPQECNKTASCPPHAYTIVEHMLHTNTLYILYIWYNGTVWIELFSPPHRYILTKYVTHHSHFESYDIFTVRSLNHTTNRQTSGRNEDKGLQQGCSMRVLHQYSICTPFSDWRMRLIASFTAVLSLLLLLILLLYIRGIYPYRVWIYLSTLRENLCLRSLPLS